MKYLVSTQEVYRVGTVEEVERLHEELKNDPKFSLGAFSYKYKCQKQKGEIIDEWQQVTVKKIFNEEKDPCTQVEINYEVGF